MKLARRKVLRKIIEATLNLKLFSDFGETLILSKQDNSQLPYLSCDHFWVVRAVKWSEGMRWEVWPIFTLYTPGHNILRGSGHQPLLWVSKRQPIRAEYCDVWTNERRGDNDHSKSHGMTSGHLICPCIFCNWFCRQLKPAGNITWNRTTVMCSDKKFRSMMARSQTKEMVANFCTK